MRDKLLSMHKAEKRRKRLRCSRCGKFLLFERSIANLCGKCQTEIFNELSALLDEKNDTI